MKTRREFLKLSTASAATAIATTAAPAVASNRFRWKMSTTWSPKLPILQESCERFAQIVKEASGGRLKIKVYAGGELIPPLTAFDAVSRGTIEMGGGAAYYWAGKAAASQFFGAVPFGMQSVQFSAWLQKEGAQLWREVYKPFGLLPLPFGNTGVQMAGWFKREISSVTDLQGLKMRIPGLGGKVLAKLGVNVVLLPGSEVYTALERGVIDATEWIGPYHDERMGLHRAAKNYYYPGWHEPGSNLELIINEKAWNTLPKDLQAIVRSAAHETALWVYNESISQNGPALERLLNDHNVKLRAMPDAVLAAIKTATAETLEELSASDPLCKRIFDSYTSFRNQTDRWLKISEYSYAHARFGGDA